MTSGPCLSTHQCNGTVIPHFYGRDDAINDMNQDKQNGSYREIFDP